MLQNIEDWSLNVPDKGKFRKKGKRAGNHLLPALPNGSYNLLAITLPSAFNK